MNIVNSFEDPLIASLKNAGYAEEERTEIAINDTSYTRITFQKKNSLLIRVGSAARALCNKIICSHYQAKRLWKQTKNDKIYQYVHVQQQKGPISYRVHKEW